MVLLEDAQRKILEQISPFSPERVLIGEAQGRILRAPLIAKVDLPAFDNSAMDGYAVVAEDIQGASMENPVELEIIGEVAAGKTCSTQLSRGTAIRIFTGSPVPPGANAVVMQEDTRRVNNSNKVAILDAVKPWENLRLKGEDIRSGSVVLRAGGRLGPAQLAVAAAVGADFLECSPSVSVGLLATGSELVEPPNIPAPGQIYESNRAMIAGLLKSIGAKPIISGIVPDNFEATVTALETSFHRCDCVISCGGVSVGDYDFVKSAFEKLGGRVELWKVAIRPGKPFVFGTLKNKLFFGLPGNPVSAFVTFLLLARPAVLKMQGAGELQLRTVQGILREDFSNRGDRRHFLRARMDEKGNIFSAGPQGSHHLSSLANANGLIDLGPGELLRKGSSAPVLQWD